MVDSSLIIPVGSPQQFEGKHLKKNQNTRSFQKPRTVNVFQELSAPRGKHKSGRDKNLGW